MATLAGPLRSSRILRSLSESHRLNAVTATHGNSSLGFQAWTGFQCIQASSLLASPHKSTGFAKSSISGKRLHKSGSLGSSQGQTRNTQGIHTRLRHGPGFHTRAFFWQRGSEGEKDKAADVDKEAEEAEKARKEREEKEKEEEERRNKLVMSIFIDLLGLLASRHLVPLDYIWIPASAFIIQRLYRAPLLSSVGFVEQAIPGIEFIPTATLGWMLETYPELRKITKALPLMGRLSSRFKK